MRDRRLATTKIFISREESGNPHTFLSSSPHVEIDKSFRFSRPPPPLSSSLLSRFSTASGDVHALQAADVATDVQRCDIVAENFDVDDDDCERQWSRRRKCLCRHFRSFFLRWPFFNLRAPDGPAIRRRRGRRQALVPGRRARGLEGRRQAASSARADADRGLRLSSGPGGSQGLGRQGQAARVQDAWRVLQHLNRKLEIGKEGKSGEKRK